MPGQTLRFALNHMICPSLSVRELMDGAVDMGLDAVELRNDVGKNSLTALSQAREAAELARERGLRILSINALYPFNVWNNERAEQASALAELARTCGAEALVLCPLVDAGHGMQGATRQARVKEALTGLDPIFQRHGVKGLVEPLGFPISSLRTKQDAVDAIRELGLEHHFSVVHDTFHHRGADEQRVFPNMTGLVHISGVEDQEITFTEMLDDHRILIGPEDRLDNIAQMRELLAQGYSGHFSVEPFSKPVWELDDPLGATRESIEYVRRALDQ